VQNFQILIVSAVKICKQCLQTASTSGGLLGNFVPLTPYRGFAPEPHWGTSAPRPPLGYSPQMKIPGAAANLNSGTLCLKKVPTFKLSVTYCWKAYEIC